MSLKENEKIRYAGYMKASEVIINEGVEPVTLGTILDKSEQINTAFDEGLPLKIVDPRDVKELFLAMVNKHIEYPEGLDKKQQYIFHEGVESAIVNYLVQESYDVIGQSIERLEESQMALSLIAERDDNYSFSM